MKRVVVIGCLTGLLFAGCGEDDGGPEQIPNAAPGDLDTASIDWVVDGMDCNGEEVTRLVSTVEDEREDETVEVTRYRRGDDCVDSGDSFWETPPEQTGDEVSILVDSGEQQRVAYEAEAAGDYEIGLAEVSGDGELSMRQAHPELNPSPRPELSDVDMGGQWWMVDYPCIDELVPQVVQILDPPGASFHVSKVVGDACIGDGENFIDGETDGVSLSGEAYLEKGSDPLSNGGEGEEDVVLEFSGALRTDHYMRLDVDGQAVVLRRVMADPPE